MKKILITMSIIISIFICFMIIVCAMPNNYKKWFVDNFGGNDIQVSKMNSSDEKDKIIMNVDSYYAEDNFISLLLDFKKKDNGQFSDDVRIGDIKLKNNNGYIDAELLVIDTNLSEDKTTISTRVILEIDKNYQGKQLELVVNRIENEKTSDIVIDETWTTKVSFDSSKDSLKKVEDINHIKVVFQEKEYEVINFLLGNNLMIFECNSKEIEQSEGYSNTSMRGIDMIIKYKNGKERIEYNCISDKRENLIIWFEDSAFLEGIEQIIIGGKNLLK